MYSQTSQFNSPPSLTAASSGSQSTATRSVFKTPVRNQRGQDDQGLTLDSLFTEAGCTPPGKSKQRLRAEVEAKASVILANYPDHPPNKTVVWEDLTPYGKVQLAFLILKNQPEILLAKHNQNSPNMARELLSALIEGSEQNKALGAFIRPLGDQQNKDDSNHWRAFLRKHPEWTDDTEVAKVFTMFTFVGPFKSILEPFVRFQTSFSKICFILSAANAILYYMMITTGTNRTEGISQYGINIGRFMRNNFSNEQVFETIFCNNGGYPKHVLESLLTHSAPPRPGGRKTMDFDLDYAASPATIFESVFLRLKKSGPIVVCDFRTFEAYTDTSQTTFSGQWDDLKDNGEDNLHAFLIVGVRLTPDKSMGGIQFLIQDSLEERPFVAIGIDLLQSMQVEELYTIKKGVLFHGTTDENCLDNCPVNFSSLTSGSPRALRVPMEVATSRSGIGIEECLTEEDKDSGVAAVTEKLLDYIGFDGVDENTDWDTTVVYS